MAGIPDEIRFNNLLVAVYYEMTTLSIKPEHYDEELLLVVRGKYKIRFLGL